MRILDVMAAAYQALGWKRIQLRWSRRKSVSRA